MTDRNTQAIRSNLVPIIEITDAESQPSWSRSTSQVEQSVIIQGKSSISSSRIPKLSPYTPPDSLMFPLFSALQRKAWPQAKRLCYELILCDPERRSYHDLYLRLEQITSLIDRRLQPQLVFSQATIAGSDREKSNEEPTITGIQDC